MTPDNHIPVVPTRRQFLATSATTLALAATATATAPARAATPNEKIRLGFIGLGGRAQAHLDSAFHLQNKDEPIEIAALCDVFNRYRDQSREKVKKGVGKEPTVTGDYRDILNDASFDAVVISTPDYWHARQTLDALAAGKHVYCEMPMTHSVDEALAVLKAWKASGRVMQVGVQSTALPV
jgi:predicted dehydrogenase